MSMNAAPTGKEAGPRLRVRALAALGGLALALTGAFSATASADERSDWVKKRDESQAKVNALKDEVHGIDADLAAVFTEMEQTRLNVANAQIELSEAEAELAAAERHLTAVRLELQEAEEELDSLKEAVGASRQQEESLTQAVGDMARDLYRGNNVSPLQVVISSEGTSEIGSRAAAASALGRVQSRALDEVRASLVVQENQQERQSAVAERITALEEEAEAALHSAEDAKSEVESQLAALETLLASQREAEAAWKARKGEAEEQINSYDSAASQASAEIARIDRENAAQQLVVDNNASRPSAGGSKPSTGTSKPSTGGGAPSTGGGTAPKPNSGALFAHPFTFRAPITSPYGWRIHPIFGVSRLHDGTDFGAGCGTPQLATRAGIVSSAGWLGGLGNQVAINHGLVNGRSMVTRHGHLQTVLVSPGQQVSQGQVIGYTGTTGNSTGCHLHLILTIDGSTTDITNYM